MIRVSRYAGFTAGFLFLALAGIVVPLRQIHTALLFAALVGCVVFDSVASADQNLVITGWYTPATTSSAWDADGNVTETWLVRREADTMFVQLLIETSGAHTAGTFDCQVPDSLTIDTGKVPNANNFILMPLASGLFSDGGSIESWPSTAWNETGSDFRFMWNDFSNDWSGVHHTLPMGWVSGDYGVLIWSVPVQEW